MRRVDRIPGALPPRRRCLTAGCWQRHQRQRAPAAPAAPVNGGILRAGIPDNPDHLDPGLSYTNEGWEILEATNNGLLTFKKAAGGAGATVVPDIATRDAHGLRRRQDLHLPRCAPA